jgi:hypothetical protein
VALSEEQYIVALRPTGLNENGSQNSIKIMRLSRFAAVQVGSLECARKTPFGVDLTPPEAPAQNRSLRRFL